MLPLSEKEIIFQKYYLTNYNPTNIRYNFNKLFYERKIYKINYSHLPYLTILKNISFDDNAKNIFAYTGMLNITKLDYYYNNLNIDASNKNHIHLSMSLDRDYILLSLVSISSILSTSSFNTFIHFHFITNECSFDDIKPIINLKKINKNVEFIFYNGMQAYYDFGIRAEKEHRGIADYSRILGPEIINNTNKILLLDSTDIIARKDLSEIYFYNLGNNSFGFTLDYNAGRFNESYIFGRNNFYPNGGICLVNVREFRKQNLYKKAYFTSIAYNDFPCPFQDILLVISDFKFKYMPLNFNVPQFLDDGDEVNNKYKIINSIKQWMDFQKFSPFKYTYEELIVAALKPVINNLHNNKPYMGKANKKFTKMWIKYSYLTGFFEKIKSKCLVF